MSPFDVLVFSCRVQSLLLRHGVSPIHGSGFYLEFFLSYFVGMHYPALLGQSGCGTFSKSLQLLSSPLSFRNEDSYGGVDDLVITWPCQQAY
jgi:hypothetical protein